MQLLRRCLLTVAITLMAGQSFAAQWSAPTDAELRLLPPYCVAKLRNDPALTRIWAPRVGQQFTNLHHYCFGLNFVNRYLFHSRPEDKASNLNFALNEFSYMVEHLFPNSPLAPEIYLSRGAALLYVKRDSEAIRDIMKAVELNPQLDKAYDTLAKFYVDHDQRDKALETVTEGLRHSPDSNKLKHRYTQLGGKQPYPEPLRQSAPEQEKTPPAAATTEHKESAPQSDDAPKTDSTAPAESPSAASDKPKIGSPSNPWCRFCPPE